MKKPSEMTIKELVELKKIYEQDLKLIRKEIRKKIYVKQVINTINICWLCFKKKM